MLYPAVTIKAKKLKNNKLEIASRLVKQSVAYFGMIKRKSQTENCFVCSTVF